MTQQPPQYRPGDVVNGHRLTDDGRWVPVGAPATAPYGGPPAPGAPRPASGGKPFWRRWWFIAAAAVVVIAVVANLGGGNDAADPEARPSASTATEATTTPEPDAEETAPVATTEPEPEPEPEPPANPYEEAYGTFATVTVTGTGDGVVPVPATVGIVTATHDGSRNFAVSGIDVNNQPTGDLLVNTIGPYAGTAAYGLSSFSDAANLEVTADGNWSITISPVAAAPALALPASGAGDAVFLYDGGAATWALAHDGARNFVVIAYGGLFPDLVVNEIGAYSGTVPVASGPAVVVISADGNWSITPQ